MIPGEVRVQEPVLAKDIQDLPGWTYQVKWDGVRMLAFVEQDVVLQNRRGRIKTGSFPELSVLSRLENKPLVLDGEVVAISQGKPDFGKILKRNFTSSPRPGAHPVTYVIFDILMHKGKDVRDTPLKQRMELLSELSMNMEHINLIDNFSSGTQLFKRTGELGWEGIIAKDLNSNYKPGKHPVWQKIKHIQRGVFMIVGYTLNQNQFASILLAKDFGNGLQMVGSAGSGLSFAGRKILKELLDQVASDLPPVDIKKTPDNWRWSRPMLEAEVEFMEWTDTLTLRAPVFKKVRLEGRDFELP